MTEKIQSLSSLSDTLQRHGDEHTVVFVSGVFDLFHFGHFLALRRSSALGDILIVQIDADSLVKKRKGPTRPYLSQDKRAEMIAALEFVSYVFISDTPSEDRDILSRISPHTFVRSISPDETDFDRQKREQRIQRNLPKGRVVWLARTPEISTSRLLRSVGRTTSICEKIPLSP